MKKEINQLKGELVQLRRRIANYKLKANQNTEYLMWMIKLEQSISAVVNASLPQSPCPDKRLIEIIKKQALIIEAAGIKYPTINQSLGHIADIYHASTHQIDKIGTMPAKINISII